MGDIPNPNEAGEWTIDIDPDYPQYVRVYFTEVTDHGVFTHTIYFPPLNARELASALNQHAYFVENDE